MKDDTQSKPDHQKSSGSHSNDTAVSPTGPAGGEAPATEPEQVRFSVLRQYVKALSFENPAALHALQSTQKPEINVNVNVGARAAGESRFEVTLAIRAEARQGEHRLFVADLVYAGLFVLSGLAPDRMQPVLLIESPRLLFPFARNILADVSRNGGFAPLMLDPIDFAALYRENLARQATARAAASDETPPQGEQRAPD